MGWAKISMGQAKLIQSYIQRSKFSNTVPVLEFAQQMHSSLNRWSSDWFHMILVHFTDLELLTLSKVSDMGGPGRKINGQVRLGLKFKLLRDRAQ